MMGLPLPHFLTRFNPFVEGRVEMEISQKPNKLPIQLHYVLL